MLTEEKATQEVSPKEEIEVTRCPECGTEWERVTTRRRNPTTANPTVQW